MILQGVVYMILGMVVVFAFLVVLVLALRISSRIAAFLDRRFPSGAPVPAGEGAEDPGELVAVILAAVLRSDPAAARRIGAACSPAAESALPPDAAGPKARPVSAWSLSGRQSAMRMRSLIQRGIARR